MALEYKTLNVGNSKADDIVAIHASFGWELHSSQRVLDSNTHFEVSNYDEVHQVTETTDFTKLVFKREKKMANYDEVIALEYEYYDTMKKISDLKEEDQRIDDIMQEKFYNKVDLRSPVSKIFHFFAIVIPLIGLIALTAYGSSSPSTNDGNDLAFILIAFLVAFIIGIRTNISSKKAAKEKTSPFADVSDKVREKYSQRMKQLREEYLKNNPDIAKLVNGREELRDEIGNLRSKASRAISAAEKLI